MIFADLVGFVTGGASGLGLSVAKALLEAGGRVAICDLLASDGSRIALELGPAALFVPADITDTETVCSAIAAALEKFGRIDMCLNAAGTTVRGSTIDVDGKPYALASFRRVVDVNLVGSFDVCRLVAAQLAKNEPGIDGERGVIINVSSIAGLDGTEGQVAYVASKSGLAGMTLAMARDLASWGIRVLTICPGVFDTPMLIGATAQLRAKLAQGPVFPKRLGRPEEFVRLVKTIIEVPMLNGEVIRLDGGGRLASA